MPVTAKLSKAFYDRLGEEIADELVEWFNLVDATYRDDLRSMNELNYARFEAKLEQRVGQLEARLEQRLAEFEAKFERRIGEQTRWFFIAWTVQFAAIIGQFAAIVGLWLK